MVTDALSRKSVLLNRLGVQVLGLGSLRDLYDHDFSIPYSHCTEGKGWDKFTFMMDFYFALTNYAFQNRPCVCYYCRNLMQVD